MKKYFRAFLLMAAILCALTVPGMAAKAGVLASDFSYRGIALGSTATEVRTALGEPLYDKGFNRHWVYDKGVTVSIARRTGQVVNIDVDLSKQESYVLRDSVRYGATSAWLQHVYGKQARQNMEGESYYIYSMPQKPHHRLLFALDSTDYHLIALRITSLPLTEEELDAWAEADDAELDAMAEDPVMADKTIDISALPQANDVKIGGYLP